MRAHPRAPHGLRAAEGAHQLANTNKNRAGVPVSPDLATGRRIAVLATCSVMHHWPALDCAGSRSPCVKRWESRCARFFDAWAPDPAGVERSSPGQIRRADWGSRAMQHFFLAPRTSRRITEGGLGGSKTCNRTAYRRPCSLVAHAPLARSRLCGVSGDVAIAVWFDTSNQ